MNSINFCDRARGLMVGRRLLSSLILLGAFCVYGFAQEPALKIIGSPAVKTVESFCTAELNGQEEVAADLVQYTATGKAKVRFKDSPEQPTQWGWHPVVIVDSYKIIKPKVANAKASVVVEFQQLASCEGVGDDRRFIPQPAHKVFVTYRLEMTKSGWRIIDPPLPRTTKVVVLRAMQEERARIEEGIKVNQAAGNDAGHQIKIRERLDHWISVLSGL